MAKNGDFVTATVDLPEEYPTRQGILDGDLLHGESGATYKIVEVHAVVPVNELWGSTLEFYNNYHAAQPTLHLTRAGSDEKADEYQPPAQVS